MRPEQTSLISSGLLSAFVSRKATNPLSPAGCASTSHFYTAFLLRIPPYSWEVDRGSIDVWWEAGVTFRVFDECKQPCGISDTSSVDVPIIKGYERGRLPPFHPPRYVQRDISNILLAALRMYTKGKVEIPTHHGSVRVRHVPYTRHKITPPPRQTGFRFSKL